MSKLGARLALALSIACASPTAFALEKITPAEVPAGWHAILRVRMPRLWGAAPRSAPPGARIRLDLDARMPEEAEPKVFFADHWGVHEARVLSVWRSRIEVEVPLGAAPGPLSEIWIEVGDERSARIGGFRAVEAPPAPWRRLLPLAFGAGIALYAAAGLLKTHRARCRRAPTKALERGSLKDYKSPRAGRS